jgi:hypothetical protein
MILGLPINGTAVCGPVAPVGWRDSIGEAISIQPPDIGPNDKDKKSSGVDSGWLIANFHTCPDDANDGVVTLTLGFGTWLLPFFL